MNCGDFRYLTQRRFDVELSPSDDRALLIHLETCDSCQKFYHQVQQVIVAAEEMSLPEDLLPPQQDLLANKIFQTIPQKSAGILASFSDLLARIPFLKSNSNNNKEHLEESSANLANGDRLRKLSSERYGTWGGQINNRSPENQVTLPPSDGDKSTGGAGAWGAWSGNQTPEGKNPPLADLVNTSSASAPEPISEPAEEQQVTRSLGEKFSRFVATQMDTPANNQPLNLAESIRRRIAEMPKTDITTNIGPDEAKVEGAVQENDSYFDSDSFGQWGIPHSPDWPKINSATDLEKSNQPAAPQSWGKDDTGWGSSIPRKEDQQISPIADNHNRGGWIQLGLEESPHLEAQQNIESQFSSPNMSASMPSGQAQQNIESQFSSPNMSANMPSGQAQQNIESQFSSPNMSENMSSGQAQQNIESQFSSPNMSENMSSGQAQQNIESQFSTPNMSASMPLGQAQQGEPSSQPNLEEISPSDKNVFRHWSEQAEQLETGSWQTVDFNSQQLGAGSRRSFSLPQGTGQQSSNTQPANSPAPPFNRSGSESLVNIKSQGMPEAAMQNESNQLSSPPSHFDLATRLQNAIQSSTAGPKIYPVVSKRTQDPKSRSSFPALDAMSLSKTKLAAANNSTAPTNLQPFSPDGDVSIGGAQSVIENPSKLALPGGLQPNMPTSAVDSQAVQINNSGILSDPQLNTSALSSGTQPMSTSAPVDKMIMPGRPVDLPTRSSLSGGLAVPPQRPASISQSSFSQMGKRIDVQDPASSQTERVDFIQEKISAQPLRPGLQPMQTIQSAGMQSLAAGLEPVREIAAMAKETQENKDNGNPRLFSLDDPAIDKLFSENLGVHERANSVSKSAYVQEQYSPTLGLSVEDLGPSTEALSSPKESLGPVMKGLQSLPATEASNPSFASPPNQNVPQASHLFAIDDNAIDDIFSNNLGIPQQQDGIPIASFANPDVHHKMVTGSQPPVPPISQVQSSSSPAMPSASLSSQAISETDYISPIKSTVSASEKANSMVQPPNMSTETQSISMSQKVIGIDRLDGRAEPTPESGSGRIAAIGKFLLDNKDMEKIGRITSSDLSERGMRTLSVEAHKELSNLLKQIDSQVGVIGTMIVGHDGLLIANTVPQELEAESLSKWAQAIYMGTTQTLEKLGSERVRQIVSKTERGYLIIANFGAGFLISLTNPLTIDHLLPLMRTITQLVAS